MKVALDTNILAYAEGVDDAASMAKALNIIRRIPRQDLVLPVQVLGELFLVLLRRGRRPREQARSIVLRWRDAAPTLVDTTLDVMMSAADLVVTHQLGVWDSVVLSAAAEAGCTVLLSQDMRDGFVYRGVTVANPFSATRLILCSRRCWPEWSPDEHLGLRWRFWNGYGESAL